MSERVSGRKRALSGIKPTGSPHLGNYLGMIRPAIELQETHEAYYFVADYHSLTTGRDAEAIRNSVYEVAAYFLAFGLDPERAVFFRQSDVPEVTELCWLLGCVTSMGLLERAHAYKAAKDKGEEGTLSHGVFTYPVLMAADILAYDAHEVPVGKDQIQHIEMTRDMAQRFNHIWGETLRIPEALVKEQVAIIPGIDGQKMSKSYDNGIEALVPSKKLRKRIMQIVTDSRTLEDPKDPETCNIFALYRYFASADEQADLAEKYRAGGFGYGHAKQALFEKIDAHMTPYREKYEQLIADRAQIDAILESGAKRARAVARETLARARHACGLRHYPSDL
ncbi:MAG: tryptophan--tRNA ligase [Myxococcales bacterium]|nr:tryptophan--tRNA ligase [Myxococcales bacterium]